MFNAISLSIPISYFPNVCKICPKSVLIRHKIKIKQNADPIICDTDRSPIELKSFGNTKNILYVNEI